MEMFEKTFAMFAPFSRGAGQRRRRRTSRPQSGGNDMDDLKRQLDEMQKRIDRMSGGTKD